MVSIKRQLAALGLALVLLFALGSQAVAACITDIPQSDCHEMVADDCSHHAQANACMSSADCGSSPDSLPGGERKWETQSPHTDDRAAGDPDGDDSNPIPSTTAPPPSLPGARPVTDIPAQPLPDGQGIYLNFCRFLE